MILLEFIENLFQAIWRFTMRNTRTSVSNEGVDKNICCFQYKGYFLVSKYLLTQLI